MKKSITMQLFFFLSATVFLSCHKDTIVNNQKASEYFPNKIGNCWQYSVYDSSLQKQYDVTVSIIGTKKLIDGIDANIWQYQYPDKTDTNYVRLDVDTIKIYDKTRIETLQGLQFPLNTYVIPFKNGQRWDGKLLAVDSSYVTALTSISISAETFMNGFNIYHYYLGPNIEYIDNYGFISNIGIVKMYLNHYNFAPRNKQLWQLKKYILN
ncbi:hypothetical protein ACFOW1_06720 [Parasediminibacterium paludis]|uniref:Lipoprotein n=1 Tax=Parasediminibacterium paludis TaxID=908966 RepID=A0ABV8PVF4_9BACT